MIFTQNLPSCTEDGKMIPLIMNNKNKRREEINRSTSDITGAAGGGGPQMYKSMCGRGGGARAWDGAHGDTQHWWVWGCAARGLGGDWVGRGVGVCRGVIGVCGGGWGVWGVIGIRGKGQGARGLGSSLLPRFRGEQSVAWQEHVSWLLLQTGAWSSLHARRGALGSGQKQPLASGTRDRAEAMSISQRKLGIFSCKNPNFQSLLFSTFPPLRGFTSPGLQGGGSPSMGDMSSLG